MSNVFPPENPQDPFDSDPARQTPPPEPTWQPAQPAKPEPTYQSPPPAPPQPAEHSRSPWLVGAVLILLGLVFLLQNFGLRTFDNWWALFILIPAVAAFASAWRLYESSGRQVTPQVRGPLIGGLILSLVAAAFLFNLDWGMIWPLFLIIIGIGALASGFMR